ncbi:uncharacterized protein [Medicago truncatula]|uniref:uncharacterized protein n=1 Tax=Medicago truncatula TaxID=3880 RepID=UPI00196897FC|nr:uncharacterized protein LOC120578137 [Medicago truncatula]
MAFLSTPNHVGGSYEPLNCFRTTVYPDEDHIEVPVRFMNDWKHELIKQSRGWIKDLVENSICIDTSCITSHYIITGGIMISHKCGFQNPQTVMLSYQPIDNHFRMEIAHEELNEDSVCLSTEFSTRLCLNGDNDGNCSFRSDSDDVSDECYDGYSYNWAVKVTDSIAKGESVLHFPQFVVQRFPFLNPHHVHVFEVFSSYTSLHLKLSDKIYLTVLDPAVRFVAVVVVNLHNIYGFMFLCNVYLGLIKGWDDLENYHGFPEDVLVEFRYCGDNVLSVQSFSLADFPSSTPSFHSRSGDPQETFGFDIRLTDMDVAKSKLVT